MCAVYYYTTPAGDNPFDKFLDSLSDQEQRKVIRILTNIETYGLTTAIPHIKKLTGTPLWEIRILGQNNLRIFYATVVKDSIIVLHGFTKKSQMTPPKEIETAINRLNNWVDR